MDSRERKLLCGNHQKEHTLRMSKDRTSTPFERRPFASRRDFHGWVGPGFAEMLNFIHTGNRSSIAKVECGTLYVGDFELLYFARVHGIRVQHSFPNIPSEEPLSDPRDASRHPRTHPKKRAVMNGATRVSRTRKTQSRSRPLH
jgi:hypothetical protein